MKRSTVLSIIGALCAVAIAITGLLSFTGIENSLPAAVQSAVSRIIPHTGSKKASDAPIIGAGYQGVYLISDRVNPGGKDVDTSLYSKPSIDGISMHVSWSAIETSDNNFNWDGFDDIVNAAMKNGKKLTVAVTAGDYAPEWLYTQKNVPYLTFSLANAKDDACIQMREPIFWNAEYQRQYAQMIQAVSDHLKSKGAYDSVYFVKVTGMNERSDEMHLTSNYWYSPNHLPCETNNQDIWLKAGFRPSIGIASADVFANAVAAAFPGKYYALSLNGHAFPDINEDGQIVHKGNPSYKDPGDTIIDNWLARYGSKFGLIWDSLSTGPFGEMGQRVEDTALRGAVGMYQTNLYGGPSEGAECGEDQGHNNKGDAVPCTPELYGELLMNGVSHHGTYFEVWAPDVRDFPVQMAAVQTAIGSGPGAKPTPVPPTPPSKPNPPTPPTQPTHPTDPTPPSKPNPPDKPVQPVRHDDNAVPLQPVESDSFNPYKASGTTMWGSFWNSFTSYF